MKSIKSSVLASAFKNTRLMVQLFCNLFWFSPFQFSLTLTLMLMRSLTAGVGLLMIMPLLQVIGFSMGHGGSFTLATYLNNLFYRFHIPLNLINILIGYVGLLVLSGLINYAEEIVSAQLHERYIHHFRGIFYTQLLHARWLFFIKRNRSDLLHGATAEIQATSHCHIQLIIFINQLILTGVYTGLACLLSWKMTLVSGGCAIFLWCITVPLHRHMSQFGGILLHRNQTIFQVISEQLTALKMIKSSGCEAKFIQETLQISSGLEEKTHHLTKLTALTKLLYSTGSVVIFSVLLYMAIVVFLVPVESLLLLLLIFSRLLGMVSSIQQCYQRILRMLPSYTSFKSLLADCSNEQESDVPAWMPRFLLKEAIVLKQVSFAYPACLERPVIQHLSLTLRKNTTTALVGPSGVGKTTLADLIVGLLVPDEGVIEVDGQALTGKNRCAWQQSVAYVTQDVFLFNASIRHNMQLFCGEVEDELLWDALRKASAASFVAALSEGLDTLIGDRGVRLSGGECQRIALARALLMKPQLLVLDESTNSLDESTIQTIQQALTALRGEMTILIISHQKEMAHFADQVISIGMMPTSLLHEETDFCMMTQNA